MKLSEIKSILPDLENLELKLENGTFVPEQFHVTEVGMITKHFIDFGGITRDKKVVNFQLWNANEFEHRLKPIKLLNIIKFPEHKLGFQELGLEVEYQLAKKRNLGMVFQGTSFTLTNKQTHCLAKDKSGIPQNKLQTQTTSFAPESGCCN